MHPDLCFELRRACDLPQLAKLALCCRGMRASFAPAMARFGPPHLWHLRRYWEDRQAGFRVVSSFQFHHGATEWLNWCVWHAVRLCLRAHDPARTKSDGKQALQEVLCSRRTPPKYKLGKWPAAAEDRLERLGSGVPGPSYPTLIYDANSPLSAVLKLALRTGASPPRWFLLHVSAWVSDTVKMAHRMGGRTLPALLRCLSRHPAHFAFVHKWMRYPVSGGVPFPVYAPNALRGRASMALLTKRQVCERYMPDLASAAWKRIASMSHQAVCTVAYGHCGGPQPSWEDRWAWFLSAIGPSNASVLRRDIDARRTRSFDPPLDLHGPEARRLWHELRGACEGLHHLFVPPAPVPIPGLPEFRARFDQLTSGMFRDFDWRNIVAAGGIVHGALSRAGEHSDIDLFFYGLDADAAEARLREVLLHLRTVAHGHDIVVRSQHAVTYLGVEPYRHVQVILRLYGSVEELLTGFDIDSVCFAWDGARVLVRPRSVRALATGANLVDPTHRSLTYEHRLEKYARRGVSVALPLTDANRTWHRLRATGVDEGLADLLRRAERFKARKPLTEAQSPEVLHGPSDYGMFIHGPYFARSFDAARVAEHIALLNDGTVMHRGPIDAVLVHLQWTRDDPFRQVMTSSFHPLDTESWDAGLWRPQELTRM